MGIGSHQGGHVPEIAVGAVASGAADGKPAANNPTAGGTVMAACRGTPMPNLVCISRFPTHPADGQEGLTDRVDGL